MSTEPRFSWSPGPQNLLAIAAFVIFILAALAYHGTLTGMSGDTLTAVGLACFAGAFIL